MTLDPKALEAAMDAHYEPFDSGDAVGAMQAAITAYLSALPAAEPVGWLYRPYEADEWKFSPLPPTDEIRRFCECQAVYARSAIASTRDAALEEAANFVAHMSGSMLVDRFDAVHGIRALKSTASREGK